MDNLTETVIRIVTDNGFDPLDYAADKDRTVRRVAGIYASWSGIPVDECTGEVEKELDRIYEDAKSISVEADIIPDHLVTGRNIGIVIGGELIWGRVCVTPKVLSVEITEPYMGRRSCAEIDILAPRIWTEQPYDGSEANEEARKRVVSMLAGLYYYFLENHL